MPEPMFTKRHYEVIALRIKAAKNQVNGPSISAEYNQHDGIQLVQESLAKEFQSDNPNFDPARFHEACSI